MARGYPPTPEELAQLAEWQQLRDAGLDCGQIGQRYGQTADYIRNRLARYNQHWREAPPKEVQPVSLGTPLELSGDAVIVGDLHLPSIDWEFCQRVGMVGKKNLPEGQRRLIIGGDTFNMESFSTFPKTKRLSTWHEERDAARVLLNKWLETFDEINIIMGNHDRRLQKWSGGELDETDIFGMVLQTPRIITSNFGFLTLHTPAGPWRITHSKEYSINAGTVGSELANKFQAHICSHHQHHANSGLDRYKRYATIDNGCMADFSQFAYVNLDDSKKGNMTNAFTVIIKGVGHLLWKHPAKTDWSRWI